MITEKMIVEETRKVISDNYDFIYHNDICSYLKCDKACVFGIVLSNLGMSQRELEKCQNSTNNFSAEISLVLLGIYNKKTFEEISDIVRNWCQKIQTNQDSNIPWGKCLEIANKEYPSVKNI